MAVVVLVMLLPRLLVAPDRTKYIGDSVAAFLYATPFTAPLFGWAQAYLHTWPLGLEEYFYLVFPLFLILAFRLRLTYRTLGVILLAGGTTMLLAFAGITAVTIDPPSPTNYLRVGGIAIGCALGIAYVRGKLRGTSWMAPIDAILIVLGFAVVSMHGPVSGFGFALVVAGTSALTIVVADNESGGRGITIRILSWYPIAFIGVISYELYLWHHVVRRVGAWATEASFAETALWAYPLSFALAVGTHFALRPLQERWRRATAAGVSPIRVEPGDR